VTNVAGADPICSDDAMEQIGLKQKDRLKAVSVFEYPSFDQAVSAVADYDGDTR
jgi:hypothetical protein